MTAKSAVAASQLRFDLNTATAAQLDLLPRIGPKLAARIISHRQQHGPFRRLEELQEVAGIGPKTFATIKSMLNVSPTISGSGRPGRR